MLSTEIEYHRNTKKKNTTIIAHKIDKLQLQILEALRIKTTKNLIELILKIAAMFWNAFRFFLFFFTPYTSKQLLMMAYEGSESARDQRRVK